MNVYPDLYLNSVIDINATLLKKNKLEALILDVDNLIWIKIIKTAGGNVGNGIFTGGFCIV